MQLGHGNIRKSSTDSANQMLVFVQIGVEPAGALGRANAPDEIFFLQEFESSIDCSLG